MASVHGSVGEFLGVPEEWESYIERLEFCFAANDVDDTSKKRAILLFCCGTATYSLIQSLVAPQKPSEMSLKDIIDKVKTHYNPRPSSILSNGTNSTHDPSYLGSRSLLMWQNFGNYLHCDYGNKLDEMLRDRIACGISDSHCQQQLLTETELSSDKAFKMAQAMELAERDARQLKHPQPAPIASPSRRWRINHTPSRR